MEQSPKQANQLGRYRLVSTLGQGGMGTIWLAVAGGLGEFRKLLVIKELRWDLTRNPRFVEMFFDEVKLAARLNHPNVVQTLEAGQEGNRYFLSMEFLDGQPLSQVMQRAMHDPGLSLAIRLRILCGALAGLHYAHELRDYDGTALHIVHRDISPHNIFVTYDGQPKVVDFGIAKAADAEAFTQPGVFKGKLAYASPEQIRGEPVDRRADIFAMGVLLWELVTLQRFAKGKPSQVAFDARVGGMEPRLSQLDFDVEPLLAEICDRAMHVDPRARFATAEEFRVALEQYLFVSGDRVDTSAIAAAMQDAFAEERAVVHRMIDSHLKDADYSESLVRQLRPDPPQLTSDDPTTVADLSELVESSRSAAPRNDTSNPAPGWDQPLRGNGRTAWWVAGALLGIAAIAAYVVPRMGAQEIPSEPQPSAAAPAIASGPAAQPIPDSAPLVAPAEPPMPAEPPIKEARAAQHAVAAELVPEPRAPESLQAARGEHSTLRARRPPAQSEDEEGGGLAFGFMGLSDDDEAQPAVDEPADEEPVEEPAIEEPPAATLRIVPRADGEQDLSKSASENKALPPAPVDVGEDLRNLRKEERRKLDLEDPYQ